MWVTDNMLSAGLSQIIEAGINGLLRQDPHLLSSLNQIAAGKSLRLVCSRAGTGENQPAWQLTIIVTPEKLHVHSNSSDAVDACITGSARALSALLFSDDPAAALYHPDIALSGDVHLIQKIHKTLSASDTRWDDLLAPVLKPVLGDHGVFALSNSVNSGIAAARNAGQTFKMDIRDYLQEESGLLPTRAETVSANNRLDALRLRIDRLQARIALLKQPRL
ncbi:MAG: SCP2 sterol-binding domain-containing protein [Pseudohongiella sp.]|nr:SCP2 sterol-binding domain-containing protein [Pseudohongiella sp.]